MVFHPGLYNLPLSYVPRGVSGSNPILEGGPLLLEGIPLEDHSLIMKRERHFSPKGRRRDSPLWRSVSSPRALFVGRIIVKGEWTIYI